MIHGGVVVELVINYVDKFGPLILEILLGFLIITTALLMWLWFSNRRKYHNLKHAIPANVVQSYLDSIIQNSSALKSSLFRGGGSELTGIPSVIPTHNLAGGESLAVAAPSSISGGGGASLEELNQKNALISSLEAQLSAAKNAQKALEAQIKNLQAEITGKNARIKELEALLAQAQANQGTGNAGPVDEGELKSELNSLTKERDELKDRLKEFEIISDDLADLKRLQQENEQLKRSLSAKEGKKLSSDGDEENPISAEKVEDIFSDVNEQLASTNNDISAFEDFVSGGQSENSSSGAEAVNNDEESQSTENFDNEFSSENSNENSSEATQSFGSEQDSESTNEDSFGSNSDPTEALSGGSEMTDQSEENTVQAEASDETQKNKPDKTSEDLLSEFEKMLG